MQQLSDETKLKTIIRKARREPVWFFENVLNIKTTARDKKQGVSWDLDLWQKELVESVADIGRFQRKEKTKYNHKGLNKITVRAMHGPGKTFGVAGIMHWFNFVYRGLIVCTAPKEKQLRTRLWPTFRKILRRSVELYRGLVHVDGTKITWCNDEDWVAHAETGATTENISGYHDDYMLFIVDEASGVKEDLFPAIEGAVSTGIMVIIILIGNPTKTIGTFYDSHQKEKVAKNYYKIHVDLAKTTRVDRKWVQEMADKYGTQSPVYKVRCLGEFAEMGENQLIALSWITEAKNRDCESDGSLSRLRIIADVADGGEDESVIQVVNIYDTKRVFKKMYRFSFPSSESPIKVAEACIRIFDKEGGKAENGDDIVVDSIGVGAGTAGYLMKMKYPVIPYKGGASSDDPLQWKNRRSQSYMVFRDEARDGLIEYEDDFCDEKDWEDYLGQCSSIQTKPGTEKVEELVPKQEMKRQGVKSPDMADTSAMSYATEQPIIPGCVEVEIVGVSEMQNYDAGIAY